MEQRPFGPTKREVVVVGQGTWNMEKEDRALAIAASRRGLDLGMTHFDICGREVARPHCKVEGQDTTHCR